VAYFFHFGEVFLGKTVKQQCLQKLFLTPFPKASAKVISSLEYCQTFFEKILKKFGLTLKIITACAFAVCGCKFTAII